LNNTKYSLHLIQTLFLGAPLSDTVKTAQLNRGFLHRLPATIYLLKILDGIRQIWLLT